MSGTPDRPVLPISTCPAACVNLQTMTATFQPAKQPSTGEKLDSSKIVSIVILRLQSPVQRQADKLTDSAVLVNILLLGFFDHACNVKVARKILP